MGICFGFIVIKTKEENSILEVLAQSHFAETPLVPTASVLPKGVRAVGGV